MAAYTGGPAEGRTSPGRRPTVRAFLTWLTVGLLLGAVTGALLSASRPPTFTAEAVIAITPSSTILGGGGEEQDVVAFVQSELILLNGPQLRARVAELGTGGPTSFSASQVGTTSAVSVSAVAASAQAALDTAALAVRLYSEGREQRLRSEIAKAAQTVDAELSRIERSLEAGVTGASALQGEYGRLLAVRSGLFRADASVDTAVSTIQPPTDSSGGRLRDLLRSVVSGGLLGALLAVSALTVLRRFSRRVRSDADLADVGLPVLRPSLPRGRSRRGPLSAEDRVAQPARLLSAQLVPSVDDAAVVVLCSPHRRAGTSWTAAALAASLVERSRVLLVLAADADEHTGWSPLERLGETGPTGLSELDGRPLTPRVVEAAARPTSVHGLVVLAAGSSAGDPGLVHRLIDQGLVEACRGTGRVVVVDAPALTESSAGLDLGARADALALVVGLGSTRLDEVDVAARLLTRRAVEVSGLVLTSPAGRWRRQWTREERRGGHHADRPPADAGAVAAAPVVTQELDASGQPEAEDAAGPPTPMPTEADGHGTGPSATPQPEVAAAAAPETGAPSPLEGLPPAEEARARQRNDEDDRLPLFEEAFSTAASRGSRAAPTGPQHAVTNEVQPDGPSGGAPAALPGHTPVGPGWPGTREHAEDDAGVARRATPTGWGE